MCKKCLFFHIAFLLFALSIHLVSKILKSFPSGLQQAGLI